MIPLSLTSQEQEFLAEVCSLCRDVAWNLNGPEATWEGVDVLCTKLSDLVIRFGFSPQKFDHLYDRLHRTGTNS